MLLGVVQFVDPVGKPAAYRKVMGKGLMVSQQPGFSGPNRQAEVHPSSSLALH